MRACGILALGLALAAGTAGAAQAIPDAEVLSPPTSSRLAQICEAAVREGWPAQVEALHTAAGRAYRRDRFAAAEAWLNACRWAELLGENERDFVPRWVRAVERAGVAHMNMPRTIPMQDRPLAAELTPECAAWLFGSADFSAKFFNLVQEVDYLPEVLHILSALFLRSPERFKAYPDLALAIAVDYDVPPPPDWPHAQVTARDLPRRWPDAAKAFDWWVQQDRQGRTYQRLNRLPPDELKFVVDAAAPLDELEWSQLVVNYPLNLLGRTYGMVRYRQDRAAGNRGVWDGGRYTLPGILGAGGICVEQAYFAAQAGKARGVPTLYFSGAGSDARHAWFGFLDADHKWVLDVGRFAEQRFVTGFARDPQTWRPITDHELRFLAEGFRRLPSFAQSRVHAAFAADYLARDEAGAAAQAARKAVGYERRNLAAWETLLASEAALGIEPRKREGTLREAMLAFQRYPTLEAHYTNRLAASLRARGEASAAEVEETRIARKNRSERGDLSVEQARLSLVRAMQTKALPEQIRVYNALVDTQGRGAGIAFFDQVVVVFAEHLFRLEKRSEALHAVQRARGALKVERGSQLEKDLERLERLVTGRA